MGKIKDKGVITWPKNSCYSLPPSKFKFHGVIQNFFENTVYMMYSL